MRLSEFGIKLLKKLEGVETEVYLDAVGIKTVGIGHVTTLPVGTKISLEQVHSLLKSDLKRFEQAVTASVSVKLTQSSYDALVIFSFNVGDGAFKKSSLLKAINAQADEATIRAAWYLWNKAGGKVLKGLATRRVQEANLYFS